MSINFYELCFKRDLTWLIVFSCSNYFRLQFSLSVIPPISLSSGEPEKTNVVVSHIEPDGTLYLQNIKVRTRGLVEDPYSE